jgi:hypothetical protein
MAAANRGSITADIRANPCARRDFVQRDATSYNVWPRWQGQRGYLRTSIASSHDRSPTAVQ